MSQFFSLLLTKRKLRFFQICLIWLVATLYSYLDQQIIAQSREIYDTWYRTRKKLQKLLTYKVHAKQNLSKKFFFRFVIHHSIENQTAIKSMCLLNFFETSFHLKNRKNSKGVANSIFRLFSVKLSFPSFVPTWII